MSETIGLLAMVGFVAAGLGYLWGFKHGRKDGISEQQGVHAWLELGDVKSAIRRARGEVGGYPFVPPPRPPSK